MESINLTPNPDNPLPIPQPGPIPQPLPNPIPQPFPIPDWWRCLRLGPVSGRYEGGMIAPTSGGSELDLRVDIDPRYANSPVMNRISGDIYQVFLFSLPGRPPIRWRVYQKSWIVDAPTVTWSRCQVQITGSVRFWQGSNPPTTIQVRIPWSTFTAAGPAEVTFTEAGGNTLSYRCNRKSDFFREMVLEVDVCQSINAGTILPTYDTHAHPTRPASLPQRVLSIEEAYREAGIDVSIRADRTIIDDSAPSFTSWSPAELHDAMETHFSQIPGTWPNWQMWGLLASRFDNSGVGGIMFDAAAEYGGAGEAPDRQGFAVFRNHSWFNNLPAGTPTNEAEAWAMRHFLYTWVHEAGHAFNFLHSWNKGRPDSLSWMNYDWRYDNRNGANSFWSNFMFRFDDEELIHMRHGDRASVIMGGEPWASGGHIHSPAEAMMALEGNAPIELLIRSSGYFEFMEPVHIELRLRNLLPDLPLTLDTRLNPAFGGVVIYIRRPDGQILEFHPVLCMLGTPELKTLQPQPQGNKGQDRYSERIFLSYGKDGFYFDQPGEYQIRALYQGTGEILIPSNVHRIRIGNPLSREDDRIAQDFFTHQVGMSLYLGGSQSSFLKKGMDVLEEVADRYKDTFLGAKAATTLANSIAHSFFRVQDGALTNTHSADPETALKLTEPTLTLYKREKSKSRNIAYHQLVSERAQYLVKLGENEAAQQEMSTLRQDLAARGVKEAILNEIKVKEDTLNG